MSAQYILALVFVLALIGLLANLARRIGFAPMTRQRVGERRLGISEIMPLDGKRKAVLLRRDGVEHLVILSPTSETVVERDIPTYAETSKTLETNERAPEPPSSVTLLELPKRVQQRWQERKERDKQANEVSA
jgi:flagellar protein FliO/FliZ